MYDDPYGLPAFRGEDSLDGWTDLSQVQLRFVRVFANGPVTVTLIAHPGVWDMITSGQYDRWSRAGCFSRGATVAVERVHLHWLAGHPGSGGRTYGSAIRTD